LLIRRGVGRGQRRRRSSPDRRFTALCPLDPGRASDSLLVAEILQTMWLLFPQRSITIDSRHPSERDPRASLASWPSPDLIGRSPGHPRGPAHRAPVNNRGKKLCICRLLRRARQFRTGILRRRGVDGRGRSPDQSAGRDRQSHKLTLQWPGFMSVNNRKPWYGGHVIRKTTMLLSHWPLARFRGGLGQDALGQCSDRRICRTFAGGFACSWFDAPRGSGRSGGRKSKPD
jgi:hypothetical protein